MGRGLVSGLSRVHVYVSVLTLLATAVLAGCAVALDLTELSSWGWAAALFLSLFMLAELHPVRLLGRADRGAITTSAAFGFALLLAVPLPAALFGIATGTALGSNRADGREPALRVTLGVAQATLAFGAGGVILRFAGAGPGTAADLPASVLIALLPAGLVTLAISLTLTRLADAIEQRSSLLRVLTRDLAAFDLLTHHLLLAFAPVLVIVYEHHPLLVPLLLLIATATYRSTHAAASGAHDSRHDPLTGLPNRRLLDERLSQLVTAERAPQRFALMLMDLDRFKQVNDALGHQLGDQLLVEVGDRLEDLHGVDTVARIGGDEFAFVVPGSLTSAELRDLAQRIIDVVTAPYLIQDLPLQIGASIGVAVYPEHGRDVTSLVRRADTAMYSAKGADDAVRLALATDERRSPGRLSLVGDLEAALREGQLRLDYQPQLWLPSRAIASLEALLRWDHPRHGPVDPGRFVHTVAHTGLHPALTRYVIDRALGDVGEHPWDGQRLAVSVNVSARDLVDRELPGDVERLLAGHGASPDHLTLEVSEDALLADPDRTEQVIQDLVAIGVGLSISDFGTGTSSLSTLRDLPVTEIKIERSFVAGMTRNRAGHRIVRAMIELGHDLGLRVVAEGIEHPAELGELERLGCGIGQGYLLCRPLPVADLADGLPDQRNRSAARPAAFGSHGGGTGPPPHSDGPSDATTSIPADAASGADARDR